MTVFDIVDRNGLWGMMLKFRYPERFIQTAGQPLDWMAALVTGNGVFSGAFAVANESEQARLLFSILCSPAFSISLMDV
ncbi:hypothetical protein AAHC03_026124 [Spirometra sp. Aus1]